MQEHIEKIIELFDDKSNIDKLQPIFDINFDKIYTGMSEFQIKHFVLNRKEFTNDLHLFQQAKFEIWSRINTFFDLYYQYQKALADIELAEGEIEDIETEKLNSKKRCAKIRLQEIEIEKNKWVLQSIKRESQNILTECSHFYDIYKQFKSLDNLSKEEHDKLWAEGWHIKSAYNSDLAERYGLTPAGFIQLPHEEGGLKVLERDFKNKNRQLLKEMNIKR